MMKHFSKIISILLTIIILGAALAGCSGKGNETSTQTPVQTDTQNESTSPSEASGSVQNESGAVEDHKVLVVYFSYTGHLDSMAHWIADETCGDIVRVQKASGDAQQKQPLRPFLHHAVHVILLSSQGSQARAFAGDAPSSPEQSLPLAGRLPTLRRYRYACRR